MMECRNTGMKNLEKENDLSILEEIWKANEGVDPAELEEDINDAINDVRKNSGEQGCHLIQTTCK